MHIYFHKMPKKISSNSSISTVYVIATARQPLRLYGTKKGSSIMKSLLCVGATGFEPATTWSQTRRATGLRYTPIGVYDKCH